jgi:hypothetical protein
MTQPNYPKLFKVLLNQPLLKGYYLKQGDSCWSLNPSGLALFAARIGYTCLDID